jgi:hypothetical protein
MATEFDPDAYLKSQPSSQSSFDPDAYLRSIEQLVTDKRTVATPKTLRVASEAPFKALAGAADVFAETPLNVVNLLRAAGGTINLATGAGSESAPELAQSPRTFYKLGQKLRVISPDETQEQMTPAQRYLDVGIQGATGALMGRPTPGTLAKTAAIGGGSAMGGQAVSEATGSPMAGMLFTSLVPGVQQAMSTRNALAKIAKQQEDITYQNTLRAAQKEGLQIPESYYRRGEKPGVAERIAGTKNIERELSIENQRQVDSIVKRSIGLSADDQLTTDKISQVKSKAWAEGYAPLTKVGNVDTDIIFDARLQGIRKEFGAASASFPKSEKQDVNKLIDQYKIGNFDSSDGLAQIKSLREDARSNFANNNTGLAKAQKAIADSLEDQIKRELLSRGDPDSIQKLKSFEQARKKIAMANSVDNAIVEGTGSVNARKLIGDLDKGLSDELRTVAEFANVAPRLLPQQGNIGALQQPVSPAIPGEKLANMMFRAASGGGAGGYYGGVPGAVAGTTMAFAPEFASVIARNRALAAAKRVPQSVNNLNVTPQDQMLMNMLLPNLPATQQPGY